MICTGSAERRSQQHSVHARQRVILLQARLLRKIAVFQQLWTTERSVALMQKLPPGALQQAGTHLALMLMAPGGGFDPRYWQGFSMQLALAEVREFAAMGADGAPAKAPAPPAVAAVPAAPEPPQLAAEPDDGLTPLARAERDAARRAAAQDDAPEEEIVADDIDGPPVRWVESTRGRLLWIPPERFDAGMVKGIRQGGTDGLGRSERPTQPAMDAWTEAGSPFVTSVPFLSRLFLDGTPVHKGSWDDAAEALDGYSTLSCHLPRVSRVRAVVVPPTGGGKRLIVLSSDLDLPPSEAVAIAAE